MKTVFLKASYGKTPVPEFNFYKFTDWVLYDMREDLIKVDDIWPNWIFLELIEKMDWKKSSYIQIRGESVKERQAATN